MIRLILVRHGNTFEKDQTPVQVGARTDLPLTEKGRRQAEAMARFLKVENILPAAIYRGPLKRQIETAQIIGNPFRLKDIEEPVLTEIDYGPWEGFSAEEIQSKWPREYGEWTEKAVWAEGIFGGEPPLLAIEKWVSDLKKTHLPGSTIVGVSSNGLIRYFYALAKKQWEHLVQTRQMETLKVKTGHFSELFLFEDRLEINRWNASPQSNQLV